MLTSTPPPAIHAARTVASELGLYLDPWVPADPELLMALAREVAERAEREIDEMPAFPRTALEILGAARRELDVDELVHLVGRDPSVALQVVRSSNSAASAARMTIRSLREAVVRLGLRSSAAVAAAAAARTLQVDTGHLPGRYRTMWDWLWAHSSATSGACGELARDLGCPSPGLTMLIGLLHDLGALPCILALARSEDAPDLELREILWMLDRLHSELGARMAARLELPKEIAEAIAGHHTPGPGRRDLHVVRVVGMVSELESGMAIRPTSFEEIAESLWNLGLGHGALRMVHRSLADASLRLAG